jgi:hypothetical protein
MPHQSRTIYLQFDLLRHALASCFFEKSQLPTNVSSKKIFVATIDVEENNTFRFNKIQPIFVG